MNPDPALRRRLLLALAAAAMLGLLGALLLRPERRSAWQQAELTRDLPEERDPLRQAAWSEGWRQLLSQADALGPRPEDPAGLRRWLDAQCRITGELQALQRQHGRPVESADQMGRPAACEQLAALRIPAAAHPAAPSPATDNRADPAAAAPPQGLRPAGR